MNRVKILQSLVFALRSKAQPCEFSQLKSSLTKGNLYFSSVPQRRKWNQRNTPVTKDDPSLPEAPAMNEEDLRFIEGLKSVDWTGTIGDDLPDPPDIVKELGPRFAEEMPRIGKDEEEICLEECNESMLPEYPNFAETSSQLIVMEDAIGPSQTHLTENPSDPIESSPEFKALLEAVNRAVGLSKFRGPMPLHELANRSSKVKELVKLGVNLWAISVRHGDLERLLHLNWNTQIQPHIRFLVDLGIEPQRLGLLLTHCTRLLWTSIDDLQVRRNYLEAKGFTDNMVKHIINNAPFWLSLSTRELDYRLGYLQKAFLLTGNEVRQVAVDFPQVVSDRNWKVLVNTVKLLERQFGFSERERKEILKKNASCLLCPVVAQDAFDYLHNEAGLPHSQLVRHAKLLSIRLHTLKPRHQFLKFLKRDKFDPTEPGYVSPDWLWQGTVEEFCNTAAKRTVEEYELFLRSL